MSQRGQVYWDWIDPELHCRNHEERMNGGELIDIQVRLSKKTEPQLFVGAYGKQGELIFEESYSDRPGETMTQAMEWGIAHAKERLQSLAGQPANEDHSPRRGSQLGA